MAARRGRLNAFRRDLPGANERGTCPLMQAAALAVIELSAAYLLALGACALVAPARTRRFLLAFASTPGLHGLELALRLLVGVALVLRAPAMPWPALFTGLGWLLVATTLVLAVLPFRWHQRFAQRSVPQALRFLPLLGLASALLGGGLMWAALAGGAAG
jgi:hypothetical protein